jgi:hypothetical protein
LDLAVVSSWHSKHSSCVWNGHILFDYRTSRSQIQSNDGKRLYRTLNHLRDGIWSHHGQQTALLEIELSLLEFAVSITRSVHAIEVSVVRDRISRSVS